MGDALMSHTENHCFHLKKYPLPFFHLKTPTDDLTLPPMAIYRLLMLTVARDYFGNLFVINELPAKITSNLYLVSKTLLATKPDQCVLIRTLNLD